ncbi:thiamine biosynthesis protein ThiS [Virgisporangium aliadipatigenens]|uniref:Thiamine biosynthesis protein ThiS n=1 Tax=Virgisporangium aliadipatigenens TaxID=741659 RepID=A0A8J4DU22_9ACTN|nr:sulfur carrier protein ThiS [Virgisporangium aliadipatigenens]GIJ49886.1 thiamine biosynthesis protein ThiS [Virgisporangium aliadipatigenens]
MRLIVNGQHRDIAEHATVADLVGEMAPDAARGIAVAVNAEVVPRAEWAGTALRDEDSVEVLTAVQGG